MAQKRFKGLVIVESPAKAKKINSYLGSDYEVMASMGHVRDLPSSATEIPAEVKQEAWSKLGVNVDANFAPLYIVPKEKKKLVSELKAALKNSDELILATDEDREGESIGWHLQEVLQPKVPVRRMVFSEITKQAILDALDNSRMLDQNLVNAQEARRVLDRLYGYRLSPLLWKKVKPKLSAGRVQSVAVRLIVQRERERRAFHSGQYWDLEAKLANGAAQPFEAKLSTLGGEKIATSKDFDETTGQLKAGARALLLDQVTAQQVLERLKTSPWVVAQVDTSEERRRPSPPFTTSTLQQEASRKLGLSLRDTMSVAQRLYENGHITYMRTDSVTLSQEAIQAARDCVKSRYGEAFLHTEVRQFATKSKGAQEAHEAIRPAGTDMKTGEELGLVGRELQLYHMIWMRTMATQMAEARVQKQTVTIQVDDAEFRTSGQRIEFPGFIRAYVEGSDDPEGAMADKDNPLPALKQGETVRCNDLIALSHDTQPPARFTEPTLIKALEADGIGRPSTYASVISTIVDRGYVANVNKQLRPTFTGMAVTQLLEQHFPLLVDEKFTAGMEQTLDDIAGGTAQSLPYLTQFYSGQDGLDEQVKQHEEQIDPRSACTLILEGLTSRVRVGKFGPYLEKEVNGETITASLPEDVAPADITDEMAERLLRLKQMGPRSIGTHPESGLNVYVIIGPFGPYLQVGEKGGEDDPKPKRVSLPKNVDPEVVTMEESLALLSLPRRLGHHPETTKVVNAGIGRFGPYVLHSGVYKSLNKDQDVLKITLEEAVELLKQARGRQAAVPLRDVGVHPEDGQPIQVFSGKYGPYVKHGDTNATLPKDRAPEHLELPEALQLLADRIAKGGGKKKRSSRAPRAASAAKKTKKAASKKAPRKAAAKKATKKAPGKKATSEPDMDETGRDGQAEDRPPVVGEDTPF